MTDCDRSLTSNCCNHLTPHHPHAPPPPCLPRSPPRDRNANALGCSRARGGPATLKSSVNTSGCGKRDPSEFPQLNSPTAPSPTTCDPFCFLLIRDKFPSLNLHPDQACYALWQAEIIQDCTVDYATTYPGTMPLDKSHSTFNHLLLWEVLLQPIQVQKWKKTVRQGKTTTTAHASRK